MAGTLQKKRFEWLDALRATAMLFVIAGHLLPKTEQTWGFFLFTNPVKIPVFFAITGYVFNDRRGDVKAFFLNLLKKIVVPWLALSLIYCAGSIPFKGLGYFAESLLEVLVGTKFWYMNCLIVAEVLFFFLIKLIENRAAFAISALVLFCVGQVLAHRGALDFFMINRAFIAQGYLVIGWLLRRSGWFTDGGRAKKWITALACAAYIALGVLSARLFPGAALDVYRNEYYNEPLCFSMILFGALAVFGLYSRIPAFPRPLLFVGRNTLVYFILGSFASSILERVLALLSIQLPWGALFAVSFLADIVFAGLAAMVINRFFPFIVGKPKQK